MHKYLVWMYSDTSGGYDHRFYDIYYARSKYEAEKIAMNDKKYGKVFVTDVVNYK